MSGSSRRRTHDSRGSQLGNVYKVSPRTLLDTVTSRPGKHWITDDVVGNREGDNILLVDKRNYKFPVYDGLTYGYTGNPIREVNTMVPQGIAGYQLPDPRASLSYPDFTAMVPLWLARMTPGQPALNVPVALGEMRDLPSLITSLPSMIKRWGKFRFGKNAGHAESAAAFAKEAARSLGTTHLWYKFGVEPTVADALAMLGLLDAFRKALEVLLQLRNRGSVKRSVRLSPTDATYDDGVITTHSNGILTKHRRTRVVRSRSWVTSRWVPLIPGYYKAANWDDLVKRARRQVMGLTPGGLAVAWWELLPWSWLMDWFARIQARLELFAGNQLLLRPESMCYCRTSWVDIYWAQTLAPSTLSCTGYAHQQRVIKERRALTPSATGVSSPSLPAFTSGQLGILGALAGQYLR